MSSCALRALSNFAPALALAASLMIPHQAAASWWNDDWGFRKRIDIDLSQIDIKAAQDNVPVLVRLHTGNFSYFLDAQADGSDIRFVAGDDVTPLDFEIEQFDGVAGVAAIWVRLSRLDPGKPQDYIWMYYGNGSAVANDTGPATWNISQAAVFHFDERRGLPSDSTAFAHDARSSSATAGGSGLIDTGLSFDGSQSMVIDATPALAIDPARGNSVSFWVRPEGTAEDAAIFTQRDSEWSLRVGLRDLLPYVELQRRGDSEDTGAVSIAAPAPLIENRWHHLSLTVDAGELTLYQDGTAVAFADIGLPRIAGELVLGAIDELPGIRGAVDELRLASSARPAAWIALQFALQSQESQLVLPGEDETRDSAGGVGEYLGLLWALLAAVRAEGWIILGLLLVMGLLSADVMINKSSVLRKVERADDEFMDAFDAGRVSPGDKVTESVSSPLASLYRVANREWDELDRLTDGRGRLPPEALEVVRSALDAEIVDQSNRLTARLVLITIAVSGGPFLGLLGTVVGVMITFATIAAAGDVNVNTIAPGVSAALTTTVMGLLVAIPSLFGYNAVASRIAKRTTAMEVFSDRLVSRLAMRSIAGDSGDVSRAA